MLREDVNRLKTNDFTSHLPRNGDGGMQRITSWSGIQDHTERSKLLAQAGPKKWISSTWSWRRSQPSDVTLIVEVMPRIEACIRQASSLHQTQLGEICTVNSFPATIDSRLNKIYVCGFVLKSTKQSGKVLVLDAVAAISEALAMINTETEEFEIDLDKLGAVLEAAMTYLGNASIQTANLRRQRIMEDINKDLVPYTLDQETHFTPMLFGLEFMKSATEY